MCGPIGSGKTYIANSLYGHLPRFNPDEMMQDTTWDRKNTNKIWDEIHRKIKDYSGINLDFCIDSAQALRISRQRLTQYIRQVAPSYEIICIFVKTPFHECKRRNALRGRRVPDDKFLEYYRSVMDCPPSRADGYDKIIVVDNSTYPDKALIPWRTSEPWPEGWYHV
jgi:predicted kinase